MGNANCVVLNDKEANVQLTAFNYCNDTCSVPVWELTLKPGETKNVSAGLDMTGVTISELVDGCEHELTRLVRERLHLRRRETRSDRCRRRWMHSEACR